MVNIGNDWDKLLANEFKKEYYLKLREFLKSEYASTTPVYPDMYDIFNALKLTSFANTRVIILGQDPYHAPDQAHGLSFSVRDNIPLPPSLKNIFKELENEGYAISKTRTGDLSGWARSGVLLLNTTLTVRKSQPLSHFGMGWEKLTAKILSLLAKKDEPLVYMLWGKSAQSNIPKDLKTSHLVLTAPHPSPLSASRGFFGCNHFLEADDFLKKFNIPAINWAG